MEPQKKKLEAVKEERASAQIATSVLYGGGAMLTGFRLLIDPLD